MARTRSSATSATSSSENGTATCGVRLVARDHLHAPVLAEAPVEERAEIAVSLAARRAAEDDRVHGHAVSLGGGDLAPPGEVGVPGLDPDRARIRLQEVVPRIERAPTRDLAAALRDDAAEQSVLHVLPGQRVRVHRGRVVARRVEPVGDDVVRVVETERGGALVHHPDELLDAPAHVGRQGVRGVIRALDERGSEEILDLESLARLKVDGRLPHRGSGPLDAHRVVLVRVLHREQRGHELRQARHRQPTVGVQRVERLAAVAVHEQRSRRLHAGRRRSGGGRMGCGEREEQPGEEGKTPEHGPSV